MVTPPSNLLSSSSFRTASWRWRGLILVFLLSRAPKSLQYTGRANIPPDVEFKDEIKAIKQTAEQAYVRALTKFHYRRLEKQEAKLNKSRQSPAPTKRQGLYKPHNAKNQTAPRARGVNHTNSLDQIQQQLHNMRQMMYEMQKCANNKDIEQYHCLFEYAWNKSKETKNEKQKTQRAKKEHG